MSYYFIFVFFRFIFRCLRDLFRAFPKVGMAFGVGLIVLSAYIAFQGYRDYSRYSDGPLSTTVASACSKATEHGLLVTLEDCQIHEKDTMNMKRTFKRKSGGKVFFCTYVPITDPNRKVLVLAVSVSQQEPAFENTPLRGPITGFLTLMESGDSDMAALVKSGLDTSKFVPAGSKVYELCTTCSVEDHGVVQWVLAGTMTIAGLAIFYFHFDKMPKPAHSATPRSAATNNRCVACGLINPADAYHCRRCGTRV